MQSLFKFIRSIVFFTLLVGCEKKTEPPRSAESDPVAAVVPSTQLLVAEDSPQDDGWETEVWSGEIQARLNLFKKAFVDGEIDQATEAIGLDSTVSSQLRPAGLMAIEPRVSRWQSGSSAEPPASLRAAIQAVAGAFEDDRPTHVSAKIVRITSPDEWVANTEIVFVADGRSASAPGMRLQINSSWEGRWENERGLTVWALADLKLTQHEEVTAPIGAFADATQTAAGDDQVFREQLMRGQDHWMARVEMRLGIDVSGWQGVALSDVDGDGLEDLYVSQPGGLPNRLFKHGPDGTIKDISAASGVDWLEVTHGSLFADLDNDSDPDLVVGIGGGILVMENDGTGKFRVASSELMADGLPYSIAAADIDQDGDLDLYVCGYVPRAGVSRHHLFAHPVPYHDANNGGRNFLFRNDGGWRFTDVTKRTGLGEHNTRFSYAATWEDYDLDGDLDLYVANDFGRNSLYQNQLVPDGRVRFTDVAEVAGVLDIAPGMSACWGDYDNDGRADLYVGNMFSSAGNRIAAQPQFHAGADAETRSQFLHHANGNSLYRNTGDGNFADVGDALGVNLGRWAWSSKFVDLDNDGWLDIVVANGFITQENTDDL